MNPCMNIAFIIRLGPNGLKVFCSESGAKSPCNTCGYCCGFPIDFPTALLKVVKSAVRICDQSAARICDQSAAE